MPANAFGFDYGEVVRDRNAIAASQQQQQLNAFEIQDQQRKQGVQNAFASNSDALYGTDPTAQQSALSNVAKAGADPDTIVQFQQHLATLGDAQRKSLRDGLELGSQIAGSVDGVDDKVLPNAVLTTVVPNAQKAKMPWADGLAQAAQQAKQTGDAAPLKSALGQLKQIGLTGVQQIDQQDKTRAANSKDANSAFKADGTPNPDFQNYEVRKAGAAATINAGAKTDPTATKWQILTDPSQKDAAGNPVQYRYNPETAQATDLSGSAFKPSGAAKIGGGGSSTSAPLSPTQADFFAQQIWAGDKSPFTGLGRNKEALTQLRDAVSAWGIAHGKSGSDLAAMNAQFAGSTQEQRTIGQRAGAIAVSSEEAKGVAGLVDEAYSKLPRTEFKPFNQLASLYADQTNSPAQGAAYMADFSLITAYARALNPQGVPREADIAIGQKMLSGADSIEKHTAVVNQMLKEIDTIQSATGTARATAVNRLRAQSGVPTGQPAQAAPPNGAGNDPLSQARDAIAKGADRNAVIQRLKQNGINPGGL